MNEYDEASQAYEEMSTEDQAAFLDEKLSLMLYDEYGIRVFAHHIGSEAIAAVKKAKAIQDMGCSSSNRLNAKLECVA